MIFFLQICPLESELRQLLFLTYGTREFVLLKKQSLDVLLVLVFNFLSHPYPYCQCHHHRTFMVYIVEWTYIFTIPSFKNLCFLLQKLPTWREYS